jgi:hypothetical protein
VDYRPLNLSEVERKALKALLETVLNIETDAVYNWLGTAVAGREFVKHLIEKLERPAKAYVPGVRVKKALIEEDIENMSED